MEEKYHLKIKLNILVCLLAFILATTLMGAYASYTSTNSDNGNANVAEFSITEEGTIFTTLNKAISPNTKESVELTIKNKSGVAVDYTVIVTNVTRNLTPLSFDLVKVNDTTSPVTSVSHENGVSTFHVNNVSAGNHTDVYTLKMVWNPNPTDEDYDLAFMGMVDYITITVTATNTNQG